MLLYLGACTCGYCLRFTVSQTSQFAKPARSSACVRPKHCERIQFNLILNSIQLILNFDLNWSALCRCQSHESASALVAIRVAVVVGGWMSAAGGACWCVGVVSAP